MPTRRPSTWPTGKVDPAYRGAWPKLRAQVLREEPTCQLRLPGCTITSTDCDHIIPKDAGGTNERSNLRGLCRSCHKKVTATYRNHKQLVFPPRTPKSMLLPVSLPPGGSTQALSQNGRRRPAYRLVPTSDGSRGREAIKLMADAGLKLDPWQQDHLNDGMATVGEDWAADEVVILVPRQNGKTIDLVARGLWGPTLGGEGLVLFTAHEFKTAREAFLLAKSLCETPVLQRFKPKISVSHGKEGISFANETRLLFIARSRTSGRGFSPDCVILDEAFQLDDLALSALKPSLAAAKAPQLWYASSAPHDTSTVLRRLAVRGRAGEARKLVYLEWSAPESADPSDPEAWAISNPGIGHRIDPEFIASELDSLEPRDFERERLGRWDEEVGGQWIPEDAWDACETQEGSQAAQNGSQIALALAGSPTGETAALVSAAVSDVPTIHVEGFWTADAVDVLAIEESIRLACQRLPVIRIGADPARWSRTLAVLGQEGYPVVEWPWTPAKAIPACTRFHEAVTNRQLTHSGDEDLATHVANAIVKTDARGSRITRESRYSTKRIDLAVAAVIAHDMACDLQNQAFKVWT
jgi:phage terminase large subunit-like protein